MENYSFSLLKSNKLKYDMCINLRSQANVMFLCNLVKNYIICVFTEIQDE